MGESYNPQGISDWLWIDTVSGITTPTAPTVSELAAGLSLGCAVLNPTAPTQSAQTISATPLCANVERTLPALPTVTPASLELLRGDTADSDNSDAFDAMKGDYGITGWLVHVLHGLGTNRAAAAGDLVDVWPATVNAVSVLNASGGAPGTWRVDFAHNGTFNENVVVVA
ncbi:hypothetical protein [Mycobacterium sp.]|uniref:phage tail tube protein n=1 Tax=Mycobacterium sp. TaxID=1785 RepID=UPI003A845360